MNTLIDKVYNKIIDKDIQKNISKLNNNLVCFYNQKGDNIIGKVTSVNKNELKGTSIKHQCSKQNPYKFKIIPKYISKHITTHTFKYKFEEKYETYRIYSEKPTKIFAKYFQTEFLLTQKDLYLDEILNTHHKLIKNKQDLILLNNELHEKYISNKNKKTNYSENKTPIGEVLTKYKPLCRHFAAIQHFIFLLNDLESSIKATNKKIALEINEGHSFTEVTLNKIRYVVDPINNWVIPKKDIK